MIAEQKTNEWTNELWLTVRRLNLLSETCQTAQRVIVAYNNNKVLLLPEYTLIKKNSKSSPRIKAVHQSANSDFPNSKNMAADEV